MSNQRRRAPRDHLNQPVTEPELIWSVYLLTSKNGQGTNYYLDEDEVAQYNADPDGFAAKHFGFDSVDDYREWVACNGAPLCSERTKSGKPCSCRIGDPHHYPPRDWLTFHRSRPCEKHGGDTPYTGPMPPEIQRREAEPSYRRERYPVRADRRCQAITKPSDGLVSAWQWGSHQCGLSGTHEREGHRVCHLHRDCAVVAFIDEGAS